MFYTKCLYAFHGIIGCEVMRAEPAERLYGRAAETLSGRAPDDALRAALSFGLIFGDLFARDVGLLFEEERIAAVLREPEPYSERLSEELLQMPPELFDDMLCADVSACFRALAAEAEGEPAGLAEDASRAAFRFGISLALSAHGLVPLLETAVLDAASVLEALLPEARAAGIVGADADPALCAETAEEDERCEAVRREALLLCAGRRNPVGLQLAELRGAFRAGAGGAESVSADALFPKYAELIVSRIPELRAAQERENRKAAYRLGRRAPKRFALCAKRKE